MRRARQAATIPTSLKHWAKRGLGPAIVRRSPRRVDISPQRWRIEVGPNDTLWRDGIDLDALARERGTPLHVVDGPALDHNAHEALGATRSGLPVDVYYSYKTNPVPAVLARLHARGVGAEVISEYELWLALRLGVPPERIIYNGPAKSDRSLETAIELGVALVNANSRDEVRTIAAHADRLGRAVNLGLRATPPGSWEGQFGLGSEASAFVDSVRLARDHDLIELRALHVHRGSPIRDAATFESYLTTLLTFCDQLRAATGWHPEILDVGGSLACPTVAPFSSRSRRLNTTFGADLVPPADAATCLSVGEAALTGVGVLDAHFRACGLDPPKLILEPGRALTGNTQLLLTSVVDIKQQGDLHYAVLDAGINVAEPATSEYHQLFSVSAPRTPADIPYRLAGPICTPADVLYHNWRLPRLERGHVLAIMDAGAYFVPFSTAFSFPRPAIVLQDGPVVSVGRRGETFDDLIDLDTYTSGATEP